MKKPAAHTTGFLLITSARIMPRLSVIAQAPGKLLQSFNAAGFGAMAPVFQVFYHLLLGRRGALPDRDEILAQRVGRIQFLAGLYDQA